MILERKQGRAMPRTGADFDKFSDFMYNFRSHANFGFTFTDVDGLFRNYLKRTIGFVEVKTYGNNLSYHQDQLFEQLDEIFRKGITENWTYIGRFTLKFEKDSFESGLAYLNNQEISETEFINFLNKYF